MFKWHNSLYNNSHLLDFFVFIFLVFLFPGILSVSAVPEFDVCCLEVNPERSSMIDRRMVNGSCFLYLDIMTNQDALETFG